MQSRISKIINKVLLIMIWYISIISNTFADIKSDILPWGEIIDVWEDKEALTSLFDLVRDGILSLLALIAITVFIFLWAKLIMAQWNAEELKKVLMQFVYSVIWLAVVAMSWAAVKLVSSLNF